MPYADRTVDGLLDSVASRAVTPAGGTAAALAAALGTALCEMACLHTAEADGYADVCAEMTERREDLGARRETLLDLADRDAAAVDDLFAADAGDAGDADAAAKRATGVPLAVAEACLPVLEHAVALTERGNVRAVPDTATGAFLVHAALRASVATVRHNLDRIPDESFVAEMETRTAELEASAGTELARITASLDG
jgi:formiminotetrahydrofolate cyclodeaminase